jgi:plastocyanin
MCTFFRTQIPARDSRGASSCSFDQTWDFVGGFAPGHYYFQCDPHALLGMTGRL